MSRIEAEKLTKHFGPLTAVDHLSFEVGEGEIFGLLGPNGAGKTTTIRMLAGLLVPSEGVARLGGYDVCRDSLNVRQIVGILTENPSLYDRLTAYENLDFFAEAYGLSTQHEKVTRIKELLEFFELWERKDAKVATFSKGMKQKLAIARALVHDPPILFLDEPTSGLDPGASKGIRDLMEKLSQQEKHTILLSTHRLEDAEKLCSHVLIINRGRSITVGSPKALQDQIAGQPVLQVKLKTVTPKILEAMKALNQVKEVTVDDSVSRLRITIDDIEATTPDVVRTIVNAEGQILTVNVLRPSLEEAYLKLVGGK